MSMKRFVIPLNNEEIFEYMIHLYVKNEILKDENEQLRKKNEELQGVNDDLVRWAGEIAKIKLRKELENE